MSTSKHDMYHLLQHLELSHPENGESPFIATNENIKLPLGLRVGKVTSSSDISCDDEECEEVYVDCPEHCGEAITFIELVGHLELHRAEGIKLDNIRTLPSGEVSPHRHGGMALSTGSSSDLGLPNDTGKSDCSQMTKRHRTHSAQKRQRDHYSIGDWRDLLRGPSVRKARAHSPKPRQAGARRLGVLFFLADLYPLADFVCRKQSLALMRMKSRCRGGFKDSLNMVPSVRWKIRSGLMARLSPSRRSPMKPGGSFRFWHSFVS